MATTSPRADELTARFNAVNDELVSIVAGCSDEQWRQITESEGWPVAVVAHHVAIVQRAFAGMVEKLAAGETYTPNVDMNEIDRLNAEHAREYANVGKPETLDPLRASRAAIAHLISGLSDTQLDHHAGVFGGNPLTVAQVLDYVVIGHAAAHLDSIRATISDPVAASD